MSERTYCASPQGRTYGTLKELNVKPGDVVEYEFRGECTIVREGVIKEHNTGQEVPYASYWATYPGFKIVSRAKEEEEGVLSTSERSEDEATPKTWGEMSDAEKGKLLLAEYRGKTIEVWVEDDTYEGGLRKSWNFQECCRYRIKPEKPPAEPKRETVTLYGGYDNQLTPPWRYNRSGPFKITFETVDGVPVLDSIKMEEVR